MRIRSLVIKFVKKHLRSVRVEILVSVHGNFTDVPVLTDSSRITAALMNFGRVPMTIRIFIRRQTTYDTV